MKRVLLVLPNGFEIYEGAVFIDVLGWANSFGSEEIHVVLAGVSKNIGFTFGGCSLVLDYDLGDVNVDDFDAIAIPGGFESAGFYKEAFSKIVLDTLREFNRNHKVIASICVGAIVLAESGILKGKRATTYSYESETKWVEKIVERGGIIEKGRVVVDGNIITSSSPGAAVDVALKLLECITSLENAKLIKSMMKFD